MYMRVASAGCFPGAWRRGARPFHIASLYLLTIKHGPFFVRFTLSFLPEQAYRAAYAARGAKRLL